MSSSYSSYGGESSTSTDLLSQSTPLPFQPSNNSSDDAFDAREDVKGSELIEKLRLQAAQNGHKFSAQQAANKRDDDYWSEFDDDDDMDEYVRRIYQKHELKVWKARSHHTSVLFRSPTLKMLKLISSCSYLGRSYSCAGALIELKRVDPCLRAVSSLKLRKLSAGSFVPSHLSSNRNKTCTGKHTTSTSA